MKKAFSVFLAFWCLLAPTFAGGILPMPGPGLPGFTPIGTPVSIGTGTASAVSSLTMTTTADIPSGSLSLVFVSINKSSSITTSSVSDGTNSYTLARRDGWNSNTFVTNEIWYKENASAVSSGATITATLSTTSGNDISLQAAYVTGVKTSGALDLVNSAGSAAGCPLPLPASGTTGTLSQANEIAFGFHAGYGNAGVSPTTTPSSGFSVLNNYIYNTRNANHVDYQKVSATTALDNNPTIGTSTTYCAGNIIATFKGN